MSGSSSPVQGVLKSEQLNPDIFRRDVRSNWKKIMEWLAQPSNMFITLIMSTGGAWYYPAAAQLVVPMMMPFVLWSLRRKEIAPIKMPVQSGMIDPNELNPSNNKPMSAQGIFCIGNDLVTGKEIWLTNDDCRQHFLVLGTTGAGKAAPVTSIVHTPSGPRILGDLQVGDLVSCPVTGGCSTVTGVFPQGLREMWRVTFEDGRTVKVDPEHLWEVDGGRVLTTSQMAISLFKGNGLSIPLTVPLQRDGLEWDARAEGAEYGRMLVSSSNTKIYGLASQVCEFVRTSILTASVSTRLGFFEAMLEQCGRVTPQGTTCIAIHVEKPAIVHLLNLAWSLGYKASIHPIQDGYFFDVQRGGLTDDGTSTPARLRVTSVELRTEKVEAVCIMVDHARHLYVMDDYIVTHNTELLIGFAANAISWGSGLLYCDGKGDVSLFAKMYALCRKFGREDDLLVLNFMNGNKDDNTGRGVRSNTLNPFSTGASDGLTQMIVGLMPEVGGDGAMWKGRAVAMLTGVIKALVWLRDKGNLDLNVGTIREFMGLKNIISLANDKDYPELPKDIRTSVRAYLTSLPGYVESKGIQQAQTTLDQHGYLEMQFSQIFGSLNDVYGHIFKSAYGQIDMNDVVLNRRILVIMLPALEKSQDELSNLGKIVVANLKGMMGGTLGSNLEGTWEEVVERRPTTAPSPFMCILDEVGYYTVDGMALMAAQARSLGFSMVYASQDIPAMQRNNEKEAASIIANTNTKIFMRTEEADKTGDLAVKSGGEVHRAQLSQMEKLDSEISSGVYRGGKDVRFEKSNRVTFLDLKSQGPGELTITYKGEVVRGKAFYADPSSAMDKSKIKLRANHFIEVARPNQNVLTKEAEILECMARMTDPKQDEIMAAAVKEAMENIDAHASSGDEAAMAGSAMEMTMVSPTSPNMLTAACCALARISTLTGATVQKGSKTLAVRAGSRRSEMDDSMDIDGIPQDIESMDGSYMDDEPIGYRTKARTGAPVPHGVSLDNKKVWGPGQGVSNTRDLLKCLAELDFVESSNTTPDSLDSVIDKHLASGPVDAADVPNIALKAQDYEDVALDIGAILPPELPPTQPSTPSKTTLPESSSKTSSPSPAKPSFKGAEAKEGEGEDGKGSGSGSGDMLIEDFINDLLAGDTK